MECCGDDPSLCRLVPLPFPLVTATHGSRSSKGPSIKKKKKKEGAEGTDARSICWETFSMSPFGFCTSREQSTGCPWFQTNFSKMFIWRTALEEMMSLWSKGEASLLPNIKDLVSLSSEFLSCNTMHCMYGCHLAVFMTSYGSWVLEKHSGYCYCYD